MNTIKLNTIGEAPIKKGGASGGGGNYVYYRARGEEMGVCVAFSSVVKAVFNGDVVFVSFADVMYSNMNALEWGFDTNLKFTNPENKTMTTVGDYIAEKSKDWTQITEEEFYNILQVFAIRFSDGTKNYTYEEGMTWGEWVNSAYSKGEFKLRDCGDFQGIKHIDTYGDVSNRSEDGFPMVKDTDLIYNNNDYICLGAPA